LLEPSDDIRQRYVEQAQRCRPQWLYRAIRICNDCDQAYRTSHNKRLQVELTLIEAAQATDDEPSAGRRPVRILKPIFSLLATAAAAGETTVVATSATATVSSSAPSTSSHATTAAPASQAPQARQPSQPAPEIAVPKRPSTSTGKASSLNLDKLTPSIGHLRSKRTPAATVGNQAEPTSAKTETLEEKPFTLNDLLLQWQFFIQQLPVADTALAQNMRIMQPRLSEDDETTILLDIENEDIAAMLDPKLPELQQFLQKALHNSHITISCQVVKREQVAVRSYDKRQQLRHFCDLNPSLISLGKTFKLELT
jgi:DNA polymerase-3 subunit gamma/tau